MTRTAGSREAAAGAMPLTLSGDLPGGLLVSHTSQGSKIFKPAGLHSGWFRHGSRGSQNSDAVSPCRSPSPLVWAEPVNVKDVTPMIRSHLWQR